MSTPPPVRGCGSRVKSGIYAETHLSPDGQPLESFLLDPPVVMDIKVMGLTEIGVKLIESNGVWHVFDIVGQAHYPNVADFIEETRRFGASRRLPSSLDFSKLTERSRLVLLHKRAHIQNFAAIAKAVRAEMSADTPWPCPKGIEAHIRDPEAQMCAALYWQDIARPDGKSDSAGTKKALGPSPRTVVRQMPSFVYSASHRPDGIEPAYQHAAFFSLPINMIVAVSDTPEKDAKNKAAISKSNIPHEIVPE